MTLFALGERGSVIYNLFFRNYTFDL